MYNHVIKTALCEIMKVQCMQKVCLVNPSLSKKKKKPLQEENGRREVGSKGSGEKKGKGIGENNAASD